MAKYADLSKSEEETFKNVTGACSGTCADLFRVGGDRDQCVGEIPDPKRCQLVVRGEINHL